tara:strand:+ start:451 stop:795 length:345 start_codon:yes stop_codon:yes gene_type:complete
MKSFKEMTATVGGGNVGVPTDASGPGQSFDPLLFGKKKKPLRRYKEFNVPTEVFRKFQTGRNKFERWSKYLNLEDANQKSIYDFAKKNRGTHIILRDEETGAMRAIRRRSSNNL